MDTSAVGTDPTGELIPSGLRQSELTLFKIEFNGLEFGIRTESAHKCAVRSACSVFFPLRTQFIRNVTPLVGRPSRHAAQAPNTPIALLRRTTFPQRSALWDR